jgi:glycosyltransferase involved in cell wall biosynthesis
MAFKNIPDAPWITAATLVIFTVVAGLIYFDSKMSHGVSIDKETRALTNFDLWADYGHEKASAVTTGKSRSVMLLHAYVPFWNAGSEVCAHTVNRLLAKNGHEVWVGVPGYPYKMYQGVHLFDMNNRVMLHNLMKHADVISTHSYRAKCMALAKQYGAAFIDWFHGGTYTANARTAGYDQSDPRYWAVFNSTSLMEAHSYIAPERYHILRPPVDWREYEVNHNKAQPQYVTLSNLNENKGGQILIDIAKAAPEIEFLGVRGSYWKQVEDSTLSNVTYINNTPQIKEVYAMTKILIMPSKDETWGRTAVEAMSSGIPVIVAPTPGLKECVQDSALLVERSEIKEWVRLIRRLHNDKAFYHEYSNRGKARARQLEPTHDLELFMEWYEKKVVPSADKKLLNPPSFLEKFLDKV